MWGESEVATARRRALATASTTLRQSNDKAETNEAKLAYGPQTAGQLAIRESLRREFQSVLHELSLLETVLSLEANEIGNNVRRPFHGRGAPPNGSLSIRNHGSI